MTNQSKRLHPDVKEARKQLRDYLQALGGRRLAPAERVQIVRDFIRRKLEHQLFTVPLLIVDDIGAERDAATDFTRRMGYLMYEARGDAGLRTIITSNLDLDELGQHQGDDRLTSRLAGRCDVAQVDGSDQRVERRLRAV